eukprot:jgi/Botrbrau1/12186/Bobra.0186s0093.1
MSSQPFLRLAYCWAKLATLDQLWCACHLGGTRGPSVTYLQPQWPAMAVRAVQSCSIRQDLYRARALQQYLKENRRRQALGIHNTISLQKKQPRKLSMTLRQTLESLETAF